MRCLPAHHFTVAKARAWRASIDDDPSYQRAADAWTLAQRQRFIDSLLNGFDVPKIYLHDLRGQHPTKVYAVVDGKQRLTAIWAYLDGGFPLADDFRISAAPGGEITPDAVRVAVANPSTLNMQLVDAQQARRVLDRLVGYQVSPVLWKGIIGPPGLSAGRVQSVALRLVVERDRAIEAFVPAEYWTLDAELAQPNAPHFLARLYRIGQDKPELKNQAAAQAVIDALAGAFPASKYPR